MVERWADTVLRVGCAWTGSIEDAQDVCQFRLSPLGMRIRHSWSEPREGILPGAKLSVEMADGSRGPLWNTVGSCGENWNEEYGPFEVPIDLGKH